MFVQCLWVILMILMILQARCHFAKCRSQWWPKVGLHPQRSLGTMVGTCIALWDQHKAGKDRFHVFMVVGVATSNPLSFRRSLVFTSIFSSILTSLIFDSNIGLETKANVLILQRTVLTELTHIILHFSPFTPDSYVFE